MFKEQVDEVLQNCGVINHFSALFFHDLGEAVFDDCNEFLYPTYSGNSNLSWEIAFSIITKYLQENKMLLTQKSLDSEKEILEISFNGDNTENNLQIDKFGTIHDSIITKLICAYSQKIDKNLIRLYLEQNKEPKKRDTSRRRIIKKSSLNEK